MNSIVSIIVIRKRTIIKLQKLNPKFKVKHNFEISAYFQKFSKNWTGWNVGAVLNTFCITMCLVNAM